MKKSLSVLIVILTISFSFLLTACNSSQSYKIYFIVDSTVAATISTKGNEKIILPDEPTKNGYTFEGWYFDKDVWNEELTEDYFSKKKLTKDIDVYAKWNEISTFTFSVIYDCSLAGDSNTQNLDNAIDATVTRLTSVITEEYSEALITRQGATKIRIEVPSVTDSNEIFELIGEPTPLYMTLEESATAQARILGTDIAEVFATYNSEEEKYGVTVNFTDDGKDKFTSLTDEAASGSQKIYIYLGEIDDSADLTLTCEEKISGGSTFISGSFETYEDAKAYAWQIFSGSLDVKLQLNSCSLN